MQKYSIVANTISHKYEDKLTIKNISFSVNSGDVLIIKGINGSGKSTLLSLILGFQAPFQGNIKFFKDNTFITPLGYRINNIVYINVYNTLESKISVLDNLNFWSEYFGYKFYIKAHIFEANIQNLINNEINTLSTGQERKINLSEIFFNYSLIWILDEPFITLDIYYRKILLKYIQIHRKLGGIIILTSHLDFYIKDAKYLLLD